MFTTIKKLLCKFTEAERDERAQLLVSLLVEQDEVEEKRRDRNKRFRDELKALKRKIRATTDEVRAGGEEREVECRVFFNQPVVGTKQTLRGDTGEVVAEVVMTEAELQENLFKPGELETMFGAGPAPETAAAEPVKDALFEDAVSLVVEFGKANEKLLQKHLNIGFPRAAALLVAMEQAGIVGPATGNKSREILKRPYDVEPKQDGEQPEASA